MTKSLSESPMFGSPNAAHDRFSHGPFCRVSFVYVYREGLQTYGDPEPEPAGTMVHTIPNLGRQQDVRYMSNRFFSAPAASA